MSDIAIEITHNGQGEVIAIKLDGTLYSPAALLLMVQRVRELETKVNHLHNLLAHHRISSLSEQDLYKQTDI